MTDEQATPRDRWWARPLVQAVAILSALAYLPALTAAPGRMPADSKLYLYLDPGRLMSDASGTFDPRQFAGWVPHQHIAFLWPSGPWFWLFDRLAVPDWIAHRLWIGSLMVAAGLGVRWCARQLGLTLLPALVAGIAYQVSPYVLPYVSRTSVMLLPWAGLGWIVGLTVRATRRRGWRDPALIALIVLTVGAVNATALAMIVPAPVLWLVHECWARRVTVRDALVVGGRTALLSAGVSAWWFAALVVQGRYGAEVLPYSESLADVSYTSTSAEVWRGLGYWLFYLRDPYAPTTTESLRYLSSSPAIAVSFLVPVVALGALTWVRWLHRRFAILLVAAGVVLSVGVHPVDDRSPLMAFLTGNGEQGLALALRSSTRALPLMSLGLALGAASLVGAVAHLRWRSWWGDRVAAVGIAGLVILNMPGMFTGAWVDPAIDRAESPPEAWLQAAAALDADPDGGRVLMLPGTEFGAYRWGYTVDQPLPGLTERDVVTRDLLPLGSPAAMDLWFAFDDRFQNGVAEPDALGPLARVFAADTVWLTNDLADDRFRTARPEVVRDVVLDAPTVAAVEPFGAPGLNVPEVPTADERSLGDPVVGQPAVPVELARLSVDTQLVRAYDRTVVLAGSGDGVVDAAGAGLLSETVGIRYLADEPTAYPSDVGVLITDSNRDRAHHWRSSQDVTGFTETGGGEDDLLVSVASDARLPVFETTDSSTQTVAEQRGAVTAEVSSYGEPFAYLPERRAVMAIDGDVSTAWTVGEHGDPIGESIELSFAAPGSDHTLRLRQPVGADRRQITGVDVSFSGTDGPEPVMSVGLTIDADGWSTPDGGDLTIPPTATSVRITITAVGGGTPGTAGAVAGVGFAEIDLGLGSTLEVVRPPLVDAQIDQTSVAYVLTRDRVDPMDRWRSDPEPVLVRSVTVAEPRTMTPQFTVRLDRRADDAELAGLFGWPVVASSRLTGSPRSAGAAAFDGDPSTSWITAFGHSLGASVVVDDVPQPIGGLTLSQPVPGVSVITEVTVRSGGQERRGAVVPDASGRALIRFESPLPPGQVSIEITGIEPAVTTDRRFGDQVELPTAIGEIDFDGAPAIDLGAGTTLTCAEIAVIDGAPLRATLVVDGDGWMDGDPVVANPCDDTVTLDAGEHVLRGNDGVFQLDRVVLDDGLRAAIDAVDVRPNIVTLDDGRFGGDFRVAGCDGGCWFVYGTGVNEAWQATISGIGADPPSILDGGFNGWWVRPSATSVDVSVAWSAQRPVSVALIVSGLVALIACVVIAWPLLWRRPIPNDPVRLVVVASGLATRPLARRSAVAIGAAWVVSGWLLSGPWGLLGGAAGAVALIVLRRRDLPALTALATVAVMAAYVIVNERRWAPFPNGAWPVQFERVHGFGLFAVACLVAAAIAADDEHRELPSEP